MVVPAVKTSEVPLVEERLTKLETHVEHMQIDISGIKTDVREIRKDLHLLTLAIEKQKIWAILLYVTLAAALLGVMARGFKWI